MEKTISRNALAVAALLALMAALSGCGGSVAGDDEVEQPNVTTLPVACAASAVCAK